MISVEEALARVTGNVSLLGSETVPVGEAHGRVLAEEVVSRVTQPPADVSSMDGYAVRAADLGDPPTKLKRVGESAAGGGFTGQVGAGEAARIFTGAPVPAGADAVVMQEDTEAAGDEVTFNVTVTPGNFIRPKGLDFAEGAVLLPAGRVLTARDVGLAAAMNVPWLQVRRRPRVAILATGNEVVMPGDPVGPAQIISSNSVALAAYVRALGGEPVNLGIAGDTVDQLRAKMAASAGADVLVTIGGASVGDYDLVGQVLGDEGLDLTFYKVAMRPGKPLIFGQLGRTAVLGLPGNPVSAGVTSMIFLRAAMAVMLGTEDGALGSRGALLGRDLKENDRRQDYLRATLAHDAEGNLVATPFDKQDSSMLALFAQADCLVIRPPHAPAAKTGGRVEIIPFQTGGLSI